MYCPICLENINNEIIIKCSRCLQSICLMCFQMSCIYGHERCAVCRYNWQTPSSHNISIETQPYQVSTMNSTTAGVNTTYNYVNVDNRQIVTVTNNGTIGHGTNNRLIKNRFLKMLRRTLWHTVDTIFCDILM